MPETQKKKQFNYRYFFETRKYLVISIGLGGFSLLLGVLFVFPTVQQVQELRQEQQQQSSTLATLQKKRQTLENVESTSLYLQKDRINAILPSSKPVLPLLKEIERVSGESGVILSEFGVVPGEISTGSAKDAQSTKSTTQNKDYDSIQTKIVLAGKIENINTFLKGINQITPVTQTTELTLKAANQKAASSSAEVVSVFEAAMTLDSYYFLPPTKIQSQSVLPNDAPFDPEIAALLANFHIPTIEQSPINTQIEDGGKEDLFQ